MNLQADIQLVFISFPVLGIDSICTCFTSGPRVGIKTWGVRQRSNGNTLCIGTEQNHHFDGLKSAYLVVMVASCEPLTRDEMPGQMYSPSENKVMFGKTDNDFILTRDGNGKPSSGDPGDVLECAVAPDYYDSVLHFDEEIGYNEAESWTNADNSEDVSQHL